MNLRHLAPKASTLAKLSYTSILNCCAWLCSPSCKIVASRTFVCDALFCCASPSSLYLPPAAVACFTQSKHSSQTELHLDIKLLCLALLALLQNCRLAHICLRCSVLRRFAKLPLSATGSGRLSHPKQALRQTELHLVKCFLFCFDIL